MSRLWRWSTQVLSLGLVNADAAFQSTCLAFDPIQHLNNATIRLHEHIAANTTIFLPGMDDSCSRYNPSIPVDSCRIALTIPTSDRSSFIFEMFLPNATTWTGRSLATGNGGIDGCIKYEDMAYGLAHGFAVTGTNNGHNGTGGEAFLNNPDIIEDFSWRALHTANEVGKTLVEAFYGGPANKSYYLGCSGGGRQGIQAADLFPEDYDGILVGAPGLNFNFMSAWRARFYTITSAANTSGFLTPEIWHGLIHAEILRQCDELDGVDDGILADPSLCAAIFRPEALLCGGGGSSQQQDPSTVNQNGSSSSSSSSNSNNTTCLTPHQVQVVRQVFSPLGGSDGQIIYPGLSPGAEVQATDRLLSGTPFPYSVDWFRYAVYSDSTWDPVSWSVADAGAAETANPGNARTWPADLSAFRDHGGKLLIYHGGADQQITHFNTERWYNRLSTSMNAPSDELDAFVRFFVVPGMGHCSGGNGAWQIGQNAAGAKGITGGYEKKKNDGSNVLAALVDWVERGNAPDRVLGTRFVDDTASKGVALQREHCRYPLRSTYRGGDATRKEAWGCA